jgi:hypothetical protein
MFLIGTVKGEKCAPAGPRSLCNVQRKREKIYTGGARNQYGHTVPYIPERAVAPVGKACFVLFCTEGTEKEQDLWQFLEIKLQRKKKNPLHST